MLFLHTISIWRLSHPLYFLRLASSDQPKFLAFKKPFFTLNSSFNHKNEHRNNIEFRGLILSHTLSSFYKNMSQPFLGHVLLFPGSKAMMLRYQASFFGGWWGAFNPTDPTDPILDAKRKKMGDGLIVIQHTPPKFCSSYKLRTLAITFMSSFVSRGGSCSRPVCVSRVLVVP